MAAATTMIAGGLAIGGGLLKGFSGAAQKSKYNKMIENYERQDLNNLAENIQLSTYGADLIKDETARNSATMMSAVKNAGSRAIIASAGHIVDAGVDANNAAKLDLDKQAQQKQYAILNEGKTIRGMQEQRENADLSGMAAMAQAGNQDMWSGFGDVAQAGMFMARQGAKTKTTE